MQFAGLHGKEGGDGAGQRTAAIELRGLEKGKTYEVFDYANGRELGRVSGDRPEVKVGFKGSLLVRARMVKP